MLRRCIGQTLVLPILLAACSDGAPLPIDPVDPVGTFDMVLLRLGEADSLLAKLTIAGNTTEGFAGSVEADMVSAKITSVAVDGTELSFVIPSAGADVRLDFHGDDFTGSMVLAKGDVHVRGTRRRGN